MKNLRGSTGFALVITLVLLALLVLAVLALSALTRIGGGVARAGVQRMQARQNAQLALNVALGELQRHAGQDARITGMAGIAGVAAGDGATTRYWCGVWENDGRFLTWLASGTVDGATTGPDSIELVAAGSVGAAVSTSANVEKEHVTAGKLPVVVAESPGSAGLPVMVGKYAYVVIDEGTKLGARAPVAERPLTASAPAIGSSMLGNQLRLKSALETNAARVPEVLSYAQLALLSPAVTPSVLQDCFHYVSLAPRYLVGGQYRAGMININTSSTLVWRSLLDTYNAMPGVTPVSPAAQVANRGNQIGNGFAAATAGKAANAPFASIAGFGAYLATIFPPAAEPSGAQIIAALGPMLTIRSDTFRIRAYGEALNPADATRIEASAYCEAMVQRTPETLPGFGRRFVIVSFRWLGPDDI